MGSVCDTLTNLTSPLTPEGGMAVVVYPNPASDEVFFELHLKNTNDMILEITNGYGMLKEKIKVNSVSGTIRVDVSQYKNGVYTYCLKNNNKTYHNGRFVVVR